MTFIHGARMDISVICYFLTLPVLVVFLLPLKPALYLYQKLNIYHRILILLLTILLASNVLVFHFWGNLINFRALSYLADPVQMLHSLSSLQLIAVFVCLAILIFLSWVVFKKTCSLPVYNETKISPFQRIVAILSLSFLMVTGIRGGWQLIPMNQSTVAFSGNNFLNQSALNPAWHLAYEIKNARLLDGNPFHKMEDSVAEALVKELFVNASDTFPQILKFQKPNIVVIILESHTADVVGSQGGEKNVSPFLDTMISEGLLFSSVLSSGSRTDQGIVSILNGWPATPYHSIMRSTEKSAKLPSLPKDFKAKGYQTSFYYGGESNFSNLNLYLIGQTFDLIKEMKDFDDNTPRGKWGVFDEYVFERQASELSQTSQPFFSVLMTLSNHEPFDIPGTPRFPGSSEADRFKSAAAYTDDCLRRYINSVKQQPWYDNTLFIVVADHGHRLPYYKDEVFPNTKLIPLLFYGNVLNPDYHGKRITKQGGHHDIPGTLLPQLNMDASAYHWSKNLLNAGTRNFSYYQIEYVMGWVQEEDYFVFSYPKKDFLVDSIQTVSERDALLQLGQAFIQKLYGEYLAY
ncbi:MAG: sulfatase-like hydrolase/transferase [Bacteroidia bacterium]|nr:sulfatase-like hydrolase/transferase [Bacteroidia bacterium]